MFNYRKSQLDKLQPKNPYMASVKIYDGQGNATNDLNITKGELEMIKAVLLKTI